MKTKSLVVFILAMILNCWGFTWSAWAQESGDDFFDGDFEEPFNDHSFDSNQMAPPIEPNGDAMGGPPSQPPSFPGSPGSGFGDGFGSSTGGGSGRRRSQFTGNPGELYFELVDPPKYWTPKKRILHFPKNFKPKKRIQENNDED